MKFLSEEWVGALDAKLRESGVRLPEDIGSSVDSFPKSLPKSHPRSLCIQNIAELPDGKAPLCYFIQIDTNGATATFGKAPEPDVIFTQPYDVAVSVAQRQRDAHAAFLLGEIKVTGDVTALLNLGDVTAQIQQLVDSIHRVSQEFHST